MFSVRAIIRVLEFAQSYVRHLCLSEHTSLTRHDKTQIPISLSLERDTLFTIALYPCQSYLVLNLLESKRFCR